ncbi:transcriptional regulator, LacI family [Leifsonia sp. 98AMF]|uniref:LacI family DNA-binding transcriptional regulator n=1 Tax=unclassified Leifsonia TaxID=2663824 RepID=UPI00087A75F9|nr:MULTISPECIES: LacI family DNA-binding transcriptional regulator [unclassified Leifsonia]SDH06975.1 transcriptional regulator, LacI family [Leifsonia sp. 197AMF]SDJ33280.1 transcriptional regulator, LacI family [Leifsonia sp. 466MF]SDK46664.1 transcriptional regulator, LacI family [Leifsonia sp. 157MF]SDN54226.1 transcriptional regulator, LacI family [Leifsonia sp. 509MF]SEN55831.1 transcriptional regulator, LacI family [Leifsonia sp. 467MF]
MGDRASMSDVARAAGVSVSTASRALRGIGRISPETRARVIDTAARLQFEPDMIARSFVTGKSFIVGVLAENGFGRFSMPLIMGASNHLGRENIAAVVLDAQGRPRVLASYLKRLRSRRIDGILVVGDDPNRASLVLSEEFSVPVVFASSSATPETDYVVAPDNREAGRVAAEHLMGLGRRHIAHVTATLGEPAVAARSAGFTDALRDAGLQPAFDAPLFGSYLREWGAESARRILAGGARVDAVFAANDEIAVGLFSEFHRAGVRVPDDIAIVGYDNRMGEVRRPDRPLTSFDPLLGKVGEEAAARLLRVLNSDDEAGIEYVQPEFIVGRSTVGPTLEPYDLL